MTKKIKKALGILLGVTFLFGLSACGGGGGAADTGSSSGTSSSSSSAATYTVGGTVSGYASATALVLYDDGGDPLSINSNGAFTFGTALASGPYSVTIGTQPTGQACSVTNGSGVINTINVVNVAVNCTTNTFTVSGTVTGNTGSVTLLNNLGDAKSVTGNGGFTFTAQNYGTTYAVTVGTQPTGQTCLVSNGGGTIAGTVTNVTVSCNINTFTVGGTVTGNTDSVTLLNNLGDAHSVTGNSGFTFAAQNYGTTYAVTVGTQPIGQTCLVNNGGGTIAGTVTNVTVICTTNTFTVSGTVTGNTGSVTLLNNLGDAHSVTGNSGFTFTAQNYGTAYAVAVGEQPTGQTCLVNNGSGVITAAVTNVSVTCTTDTHTVSGTVTGNTGTVKLLNNLIDARSVTGNSGFMFTAQNYGTSYAVTVGTHPAGQVCSVNNGSGIIIADVVNILVKCVNAPVVSVSYNYNPNEVILNWVPFPGATYYTVSKDPTGSSGYSPICQANSPTATECIDTFTKLTNFITASYKVSACNAAGCIESAPTAAFTTQAIQYLKASNVGGINAGDEFGNSVALSADGSTLAVGAVGDESSATGINGNQADNGARLSGAVYVFTRSGTSWSQQAYVKASNTNANDTFGWSVALSADGSTLAVGAYYESSSATGINGNQNDNSDSGAGAVYIFKRSGVSWSQQSYIKAFNTDGGDHFGNSVALSSDGSTLAVGALGEACAYNYNYITNLGGFSHPELDNSYPYTGAVYVFTRIGTVWSQQAYLKASYTYPNNQFGNAVALSADGNTLAVGTNLENQPGVNFSGAVGAVYVYTRSGTSWLLGAYVKASNPQAGDQFGSSVALSSDGSTLAIGAIGEASNATGINGNQTDNSASDAGAVYVFTRNGDIWSQQAYVKASNAKGGDYSRPGDQFGYSVALSADGGTLAVGAQYEASAATGVNGDQTDKSALEAGAVYVFTRSGNIWNQQAYVKASNTNAADNFGSSVALSSDGSTLAVAAIGEASNATGINGNQADNSANWAGAVYVY